MKTVSVYHPNYPSFSKQFTDVLLATRTDAITDMKHLTNAFTAQKRSTWSKEEKTSLKQILADFPPAACTVEKIHTEWIKLNPKFSRRSLDSLRSFLNRQKGNICWGDIDTSLTSLSSVLVSTQETQIEMEEVESGCEVRVIPSLTSQVTVLEDESTIGPVSLTDSSTVITTPAPSTIPSTSQTEQSILESPFSSLPVISPLPKAPADGKWTDDEIDLFAAKFPIYLKRKIRGSICKLCGYKKLEKIYSYLYLRENFCICETVNN
jgi:hypothetical protein